MCGPESDMRAENYPEHWPEAKSKRRAVSMLSVSF